jgi:hypothetical protein
MAWDCAERLQGRKRLAHDLTAAFSQRDQLFAKMGQMFFHEKMLFHGWAANEAATLSRITIPKIRLGPSAPFDARFRLSAAFHSRVFLCPAGTAGGSCAQEPVAAPPSCFFRTAVGISGAAKGAASGMPASARIGADVSNEKPWR